VYVSTFWSYRSAGAGYLAANHLTNESLELSSSDLAALEDLYNGGGSGVSAHLMSALSDAHLIFTSQEAAEDWLAGTLSSADLRVPNVDQIELTNRCPYTCEMCPRTTSMDRALGSMTVDMFTSVVGQIAATQSYTALHHFGESLLHRDIDRAVRVALENGVRTGLSCNPPSLPPRLSARLLDAGLANMVLSLDSLKPDVYQAIRGRAANFDRADANLRELVRQRDAGGYGTWITLQMISMHANQSEIDGFLGYCEEVGVDRGVVVRLGRWDFDDAQVASLGNYDSPGYTAPCPLPFNSVVVLWDGRVVPCCHDYNGEVVLGDLRQQSLEEVWQGPAARRFRERNAEYQLCRQCGFSRWYKEQQRTREGFWNFHRHRQEAGARRYEWTNDAALARADGRALFDRFDVYTRETNLA
jgi:radical SAM protein with 4Fe4S-binding SPASM domain